jgi:hypothetical protein
MGMNDYISKPLTKEDVVRVLATVPRLARNTPPYMFPSPPTGVTPPTAIIATANTLLSAAALPK